MDTNQEAQLTQTNEDTKVITQEIDKDRDELAKQVKDMLGEASQEFRQQINLLNQKIESLEQAKLNTVKHVEDFTKTPEFAKLVKQALSTEQQQIKDRARELMQNIDKTIFKEQQQ